MVAASFAASFATPVSVPIINLALVPPCGLEVGLTSGEHVTEARALHSEPSRDY